MNAPNNNLRVKVWDIGPKAPDAPKRPAMPKDVKPGSPEEMVAEYEFKAAMSTFERDRDDYARMHRDFDRWQHLNGGPYQIEMWSVNAIEAMQRDPERYLLKLPKGMKPGKQHLENERRAQEEVAELDQLRERDPQFGNTQFGRGAAA